MNSPTASLHLVGPGGCDRARVTMAAWDDAYPGGRVCHSQDLTSAMTAAAEDCEVLVLLEADPSDIRTASAAIDARGSPLWAVLPEQSGDAPVEWERQALTQAMRFAVTTCRLRRENARLRGDLVTIGRRFAHDYRTALNSISTANEILREPRVGATAAAQLHHSISDAVHEAGDLIRRIGEVLLATARPTTFEPVKMDEVIWNALQTLDAPIRSAEANIITAQNWPTVLGAPPLLELVWSNLLMNSLQHAGRAPRIELGWDDDGSRHRFWLRDSGFGVELGKRSRLFFPLDRLHELNAPRGYGLSVVQRLVDLHSGTTGYTMDPVPGGTFFFTLPMAEPKPRGV